MEHLDGHKQLTVMTGGSAAAAQAAAVFARCMRERCPVEIGINTAGGFLIELVLSVISRMRLMRSRKRREDCASALAADWAWCTDWANSCVMELAAQRVLSRNLARAGTTRAAGARDLFCHPFP